MTLAVSVGDPAGVGPWVSVKAALSITRPDPIVLFGDAERLHALAVAAGAPAASLIRVDVNDWSAPRPGELGLCHVSDWHSAVVDAHAPSPEGGVAQLAALDAATAAVLDGRARALVTAPTSKEAVTMGGTEFTGQTERLAASSGLRDDAVTMMFLGPRLRVALVTTHLSMRCVSDAITGPRVERAITHLGEALLRLPRLAGSAPRLAVAGLNPHAGESGLFGDEEIRVIAPAIERTRSLPPFADDDVHVLGLIPSETAFRMASEGHVEGVVAMIHDQATIASKLLDWERAVNVTWGLPFVRTSVDHGVAYDAARHGRASSAGMLAALQMAQELCPPP